MSEIIDSCSPSRGTSVLYCNVAPVMNVLTSLSARLGSTTLARGMLTGSLLGWTVLRGILIGRLVMLLSP